MEPNLDAVLNGYTVLAISFVTAFIIFVILLWRLIRFTKQRIIDLFHLNNFFNCLRAGQYSRAAVNQKVAEIIWRKVPEGGSTVRNGWIIEDLENPLLGEGERSVLISRDNRPFQPVCSIMVRTDIPGIVFSASVTSQTLKDYENMMNISGYKMYDVFRLLREVQAGNEETKNQITHYYIDFALKEVL